jgi:hypothetical protein
MIISPDTDYCGKYLHIMQPLHHNDSNNFLWLLMARGQLLFPGTRLRAGRP